MWLEGGLVLFVFAVVLLDFVTVVVGGRRASKSLRSCLKLDHKNMYGVIERAGCELQ
jgi:hypothetical protein